MAQKITTFLMFEGRAEEAMRFYISLFPNSSVESIERYGKEGPGKEGSVMMPLNNYGFSKKFGWTADRFGVSWQLTLA